MTLIAGRRTENGRWLSLDIVRGATVAGMLLVNNPGTWAAIYPPLRHAVWHGWTPTDLVFPFFLFIVGITTELSLGRRASTGATDGAIRRQVLRRSALIVLIGLGLAAFPFFPLERFETLRVPGVLQRIGICYAAAALLAWRRPDRSVALTAVALLLGYWAAMTLVPVPGVGPPTLDPPEATLAAWLDRALLDGHLWSQSRTWDPEGILSTFPAIGTTLLGVLTGRWMQRELPLAERLSGLFAGGAMAAGAGAVWGWVFPINKNLWTSSYVLLSAGLAALTLATVTWVVEVRGQQRWARPLVTYGLNPMVAFAGSGLMAKLMGGLIRVPMNGESVPLQRAIYQATFEAWLPPHPASLAYALSFVLVWYLILLGMERRGWVLKI